MGGGGQGGEAAAVIGGDQFNAAQPVQELAAFARIGGGHAGHEAGNAQIAGAGHIALGRYDAVEGGGQEGALLVAQNCVGGRH